MSLQDNVNTATAVLAAANAALQAAEAALSAAQPHVALWDEVIAEAEKLGNEMALPFRALADRAKTLLEVL